MFAYAVDSVLPELIHNSVKSKSKCLFSYAQLKQVSLYNEILPLPSTLNAVYQRNTRNNMVNRNEEYKGTKQSMTQERP